MSKINGTETGFNLDFHGEWHDVDSNADIVLLWGEDYQLLARLDLVRRSGRVSYTATRSDVFNDSALRFSSGYMFWEDALRALFSQESDEARVCLNAEIAQQWDDGDYRSL